MWSPHLDLQDEDPLGRGIPKVDDQGVKLLGAPLGNEAFTNTFLNKRIDSIERVVSKLPGLQDPLLEFTLLRSCFALPKFSYSLRTTDPVQHQATMHRFDNLIRVTLEDIIGAPLTDPQWTQAALHLSFYRFSTNWGLI